MTDDSFDNLHFDFEGRTLPRFVAVEGNIGVGKTTLAKRLASTFSYQTLLEAAEENPFLERFYLDRKRNALPTQLYFLFQRSQQFRELRQGDMFSPLRIADFLLNKDPLFARVTLDDDEFNLYKKVYDQLIIDAPKPDLVVYLQAPVDTLMKRVRQRGIAAEQRIDLEYLQQLNEAYTQLFHYYNDTPLLIVNAADIDLANNPAHYRELVEYMLTIRNGRHYYNPSTI
ncbi:MAG: deoxynucleoside kinase [Pseudomonadales bacterium]|jgi:deoxyguanosine kinase|nr:deoxynucleoside kinase [Pseudomonadales bacterium]